MHQIIDINTDNLNNYSTKFWPVPDSYSDRIPDTGSPGSFWENRGETFHCGVDFYAPQGSAVIAIEGGIVIDKGVFTNPEKRSYWNLTYYVVIKTSENINYKYAELEEVFVQIGHWVYAGTKIGQIGVTIDKDRINPRTPYYVRELIRSNHTSMLHLEMYEAPIIEVRPYAGGNFEGKAMPLSLIDPNFYLAEIAKQT
jgi:murein DD-endopeptidase MepM/ murein hydrolase activator NlpD